MNKLLALLLGNLFNKGFMPFAPSKRTVDGAMVHFHKAMDELKAVEEQEEAEAKRREQEIAEASEALNRARREAARSRNKQAKILHFIGDDDVDVEVATIDTLREVKFDPAAR